MTHSPMVRKRISCVAAVLIAGLGNLGCLATYYTVQAAKTTHHYYDDITTLRSATQVDRTVILHMETSGHSKSAHRELSFAIDLDDPNWGLGEDGHLSSSSCYRQPVTISRPSWTIAEEDTSLEEGAALPIDRLPYLPFCAYDRKFMTLPEGVHVLAIEAPGYEPSMRLEGSLGPPDTDHLPPVGASVMLVSKSCAEDKPRILYLDFVHEKEKGKHYLFAATPVTVAFDVITSPIQFVLGLVYLATGD